MKTLNCPTIAASIPFVNLQEIKHEMNQQQYYQQQQRPPQGQMYAQNQQQPMYIPQTQMHQQQQPQSTYQPQQTYPPQQTYQPQQQQQTPIIAVPIDKTQYVDDVDAIVDNNAWRDIIWAIAFYISVIGMGILAVISIKEGKLRDTFQSTDDDLTVKSGLLAAGIGAGTLFTAMWLGVMTCCASVIIKFCLLLFPVLTFITAGAALVAGQIVSAIIAAIFGVIGLVYAWFVWKSVPFATVCLNIAIAAFYQFKMTLFVNLVCVSLAVECLCFINYARFFFWGKVIQNFLSLFCVFCFFTVCVIGNRRIGSTIYFESR